MRREKDKSYVIISFSSQSIGLRARRQIKVTLYSKGEQLFTFVVLWSTPNSDTAEARCRMAKKKKTITEYLLLPPYFEGSYSRSISRVELHRKSKVSNLG